MAVYDQVTRIKCTKCGCLKFTKQTLYVADQDNVTKDLKLYEIEEGLFCTKCNHLEKTLEPKK